MAAKALEYIKATMPALFLNGLVDGQRRMLNCFEYGTIGLVCQLLAVICQIAGCYVALEKYDLGIAGIGYANNISQVLSLICITAITSCVPALKPVIQLPDWRTL